MQEILGFASGSLIAISCVPYIRDILRGKTKPQRMTWFIWVVLLVIAFFAQVSEGGTWSLITTGVDLLGVIVIFILAIPHGMGGTTKFDILALAGSALGLLMWYLTSQPVVALVMMILIDMIACSLTVVKTYKHPETETFNAYIICGTGGLLGAFAVGAWDFSLLVFPLWIFVANYTIGLTILIGKRKNRHI